jgi:hypothetical protein
MCSSISFSVDFPALCMYLSIMISIDKRLNPLFKSCITQDESSNLHNHGVGTQYSRTETMSNKSVDRMDAGHATLHRN